MDKNFFTSIWYVGSNYAKKADEFLKKYGVKLYITYKDTTDNCPWDGQNPHDRFRIVIRRKKDDILRYMSYYYFNSVKMCRRGEKPTPYDILADLAQYINFPPSLDNFINDFGSEITCAEDFRMLENQFNSGKKMQQKTRKIFSDCLYELAAIK